ncbi:MAG: imidazoleglycerol-phosphate dehydratase [Bacillota bacterium]|nr:imidazoleglycerol-phosphate dehydratase [Bacillota bacterium]
MTPQLPPPRAAEVSRQTGETSVAVTLALDGQGAPDGIAVDSGVPFLDHLLTAAARHGRFGLRMRVRGDLCRGAHHTAEDAGLGLGEAVRVALCGAGGGAVGDAAPGVARFGDATVPMDDALVMAAVDLGGRPFFAAAGIAGREAAGGFEPALFLELCRALATAGHLGLHLRVLAGDDTHHVLEAAAKSLGVALRRAWAPDPAACGAGGPVSTKGPVRMQVR